MSIINPLIGLPQQQILGSQRLVNPLTGLPQQKLLGTGKLG